MSEPLTLAFFAAKGGQGTTVIAASVALLHADAGRRTLLIDAALRHDTFAVLGCTGPGDVSRVVENLDVRAVDPVVGLDAVDTSAYDVVVIDAGQRRPETGTATLVVRPCYLALRQALTVTPPADNAVVITETGRALDESDVASVLGLDVVAVIPADPAVARTVDAGLLATRLPSAIDRHRAELLGAACPVSS